MLMSSSLCVWSSKDKKTDLNQHMGMCSWINDRSDCQGVFFKPGYWSCDANTGQDCWETWIWILAFPPSSQTASVFWVLASLHSTCPPAAKKDEFQPGYLMILPAMAACFQKVLHDKASFPRKNHKKEALNPLSPPRSLRSRGPPTTNGGHLLVPRKMLAESARRASGPPVPSEASYAPAPLQMLIHQLGFLGKQNSFLSSLLWLWPRIDLNKSG